MADDLARKRRTKRRGRPWDADRLGNRRAQAHLRNEALVALRNAPARLSGRRAALGTSPFRRRGSVHPQPPRCVCVSLREHVAPETHGERRKDLVNAERPMSAGRRSGDIVRLETSRLGGLHGPGRHGVPAQIHLRDGGRGPKLETGRKRLLEAVPRRAIGVRLPGRHQLHEQGPRTFVGSPRRPLPHRGWRPALEGNRGYCA